MLKDKCLFYKEELTKMFPNASCELDYHNVYELSVAVILSAQTSDKAVNKVTPNLFKKYPTIKDLAYSNMEEVEKLIASIGLSKRKSEYIIKFAEVVLDKFDGIIPNTIEELITIPGIGRKTANVIVSEGYKMPGFAVDVHVTRVTNRLGIVDTTDPVKIEYKLKDLYNKEDWHQMHHLFIFLGRYMCKSQKPNCQECLLKKECQYYHNN